MTLIAGLAGCNPRPTMAVGGITAVAGLVIAAVPDDCEQQTFCLIDNQDVGTTLIIAGLVTFLIGAIGLANEAPPPKLVMGTAGQPVPQPMAHAPPAPFPVGPDPYAEPDPAAEVRVPDPPGTPPLPALELDYPSPAERQFAIQASAAARRGNCRAANTSAEQLTVDTRHRLAAVDADFARCQDQR